MILSGTGHRPKGLGLNYSEKSNQLLKEFCISGLKQLNEDCQITKIISGGATGWDQSLAETAIILGIPLELALPFTGFGSNWPPNGQKRFKEITNKAIKIHYTSNQPYYSPSQYIIRDQFLVDNCDILIALYSGIDKSGTGATVKYAEKQGKTVINVWDNWVKYKESMKF